jgi:hypothetical protein
LILMVRTGVGGLGQYFTTYGIAGSLHGLKYTNQPHNVLWNVKDGYEVKLLEAVDIKR